jgi:NitT/TauT family transport system substrate-binding protein
MVSLTPLAKGLLTIAVLAGAGAAVWHGGAKDWFKNRGVDKGISGTTTSEPSQTTAKALTAALGTAENPLKVSIVSFHGYAPALVANGKSLKTAAGSIYGQKGLNVEFVIQDDIPTLSTIFESGTAQCAWRTSDFWAQEQPNLRNSGHDGKAIMIVDNTQGADAVISNKPDIKTIEDLAGRSVALLQFTPSHGMVIDAVENSSLTAKKRASVKYVYINAEEGTAGVRAALESGSVDAAALWDPDLSLAARNIKGSRIIYSTKTATNLIYDVIVCDKRFLDKSENDVVFQKFVAGWMEGVQVARANPDEAADALAKTEEFFTLLEKQEGRGFVKSLFSNIVWTGVEENARALGLVGGTNHYERVYQRFDQIYREAGALANPKSPVIPAQDSFDYRFIKSLLASNQQAQTEAAKPEYQYTDAGREAAAATNDASVTKPVTVNFASGSAVLNKRGQQLVDKEMVPFIENNGGAYFIISGNTDSTGGRDINMALSRQRAEAVATYLAGEWDIDRARFKVVGNGPDQPICNESNPAADGLSLEECRAVNRTTRLAVVPR